MADQSSGFVGEPRYSGSGQSGDQIDHWPRMSATAPAFQIRSSTVRGCRGARTTIRCEGVTALSGNVESIQVPGGVVTIDLGRGHGSGFAALKMAAVALARGGYSARGVSRDIVIRDASGEQEPYREGPYDGITVNRALDRLVVEIERDGLTKFLRSRQVAHSQFGAVVAPSGRLNQASLDWEYLGALLTAFKSRLGSRSKRPQ